MTNETKVKIARSAVTLLVMYILAVFAMSAWRHLSPAVKSITGPSRYGAYAEVPK